MAVHYLTHKGYATRVARTLSLYTGRDHWLRPDGGLWTDLESEAAYERACSLLDGGLSPMRAARELAREEDGR